MYIAIAIIIIGAIYLLKNLGVISVNLWSIIWPILIILFGIALLIRKKKYRDGFHKLFKKN